MNRAKCFLLRIVGSFIASCVIGILVYALGAATVGSRDTHDDMGVFVSLFVIIPLYVVAAVLGAAVGATLTQIVLRQRSSFWRALLGAVLGLVAGLFPAALCLWTRNDPKVWHNDSGWWFVAIAVVFAAIIVGSALGSGWGELCQLTLQKGKAGDTVKQRR